MRVNIIMEAELTSVALNPSVRGVPPAVPQSVWIILGDFDPPDDDDSFDEGFDFHPILELDPDTGTHHRNPRYPMGSLAHEDFLQIVKSYESVKLIESCTDKGLRMHAVKTLKNIFETLGHEVFLLETCDY